MRLQKSILAALVLVGAAGLVVAYGGWVSPVANGGGAIAAAPAAAAETSGLDELSAADRKAAEKQKICPVSGEPLGGMGKPYKLTYKGRDIFLCCEGCKAAFQKNPKKYLKKLDKPVKEEK